MTSTYEYLESLESVDDLDAYAALRARAFVGPFTTVKQMIARDPTNVRGLVAHGEFIAGLHLVPMGQFFGGRRVSATGVAAVAVAPHARGRGAATELMRCALREIASSGAAVSTLYPATYALYRRVGYELAGGHYRLSVATRAIGIHERDRELRAMNFGDFGDFSDSANSDTDSDTNSDNSDNTGATANQRAMAELYQAHARHQDGWLDRSPYIWHRVLTGPGQGYPHGYWVLDNSGQPDGYILYRQEHADNGHVELHIEDMVARTPGAGRRLLSFLSDHQAQVPKAVWYGSAHDSLAYLLPELGCELTLAEPWMLRIVDVARALTERGYAPELSTRLDLAITDELLPENHGRFVLDLERGTARVRRGGRGSIALSIETLASLYTGFMNVPRLMALDRVRATNAMARKLASVFPAGNPSLPDFF